MAIGLLLDLFSSDFAIVSTPSEQSIIIDCKRHPTNYTINRLPLFAIICHRLPRVNTLSWGVSRLRRWEGGAYACVFRLSATLFKLSSKLTN